MYQFYIVTKFCVTDHPENWCLKNNGIYLAHESSGQPLRSALGLVTPMSVVWLT